jgi:hypothetical protein
VSAERIIHAALAARSEADAVRLDGMITAELGSRFYRPIGDKVNNFGLMTTSGSYDYKLIENVTNMQDALLERAAMARFGNLSLVPYGTPREAAAALLAGRGEAELARCAGVEFFEGVVPAKRSRRITPVFRDEGLRHRARLRGRLDLRAGLGTQVEVLVAAGRVRDRRRHDIPQRGGGRAREQARTGDAPGGGPDPRRRLSLAALGEGEGPVLPRHERLDEGRNPRAMPWSAPASEFPDFAPGTHLALIEYGTERLHSIRHSDNPNSFDRVLDTKLFAPISPVRFRNHLIRADHARVRRGLARRFEDNPRTDRRERTANMPFRVGGQTYELPVTFYFFDSAGRAATDADTVGDKKNFVAYGHSLMFTSNGQAHHHWTPLEFRDRTRLNKVAEHVLVVVETDPLPIAVRTDFFTADRSGVRASEETLRLESSVAEFLAGWDELREINSNLVLESIRSSRNARPTLEISRQISRALAARQNGFSLLATNRGGTFGREPRGKEPKAPAVLHRDPTLLRGPERVAAVRGTSKTVRYVLDASDEFMATGRGRLTLHPSRDRGRGHRGRAAA